MAHRVTYDHPQLVPLQNIARNEGTAALKRAWEALSTEEQHALVWAKPQLKADAAQRDQMQYGVTP